MKLRNKLIPAAGLLACTSLATTPLLATSCTTKKTFYTYDLTEENTCPLHSAARLSQFGENKTYVKRAEASQFYVQQVQADPRIFISDMCQSYYQYMSFYYGDSVKSFTLSLTNPTFNSTKVSYPGEDDVLYPTISFDMKVHLELKTITLDEDEQKTTTTTQCVDLSSSFNNVIAYAYESLHNDEDDLYDDYYAKDYDGFWYFGILDPADTNDGYGTYAYKYSKHDWSIDVNYKNDATYKITNEQTGITTTDTENYAYKQKIKNYDELHQALSNFSYQNKDAIEGYLPLYNAIVFDFHSDYLSTNIVNFPELTIQDFNGRLFGARFFTEAAWMLLLQAIIESSERSDIYQMLLQMLLASSIQFDGFKLADYNTNVFPDLVVEFNDLYPLVDLMLLGDECSYLYWYINPDPDPESEPVVQPIMYYAYMMSFALDVRRISQITEPILIYTQNIPSPYPVQSQYQDLNFDFVGPMTFWSIIPYDEVPIPPDPPVPFTESKFAPYPDITPEMIIDIILGLINSFSQHLYEISEAGKTSFNLYQYGEFEFNSNYDIRFESEAIDEADRVQNIVVNNPYTCEIEFYDWLHNVKPDDITNLF